jgi:hypothetical protein
VERGEGRVWCGIPFIYIKINGKIMKTMKNVIRNLIRNHFTKCCPLG